MAFTFSSFDGPPESISTADPGILTVVTFAIDKELTIERTRDEIINTISGIVERTIKSDHKIKIVILLDGSVYAIISPTSN